jgi:hypothetical protein
MDRRQSLAKCPSAPNIAALSDGGSPLLPALATLGAKPIPPALLGGGAARASVCVAGGAMGSAAPRRQSSSIRRGCPLLSPHPLQRQALSVDYTNINYSPLMFMPRPPPLDSPKSSVERAVSEVSTLKEIFLAI